MICLSTLGHGGTPCKYVQRGGPHDDNDAFDDDDHCDDMLIWFEISSTHWLILSTLARQMCFIGTSGDSAAHRGGEGLSQVSSPPLTMMIYKHDMHISVSVSV